MICRFAAVLASSILAIVLGTNPAALSAPTPEIPLGGRVVAKDGTVLAGAKVELLVVVDPGTVARRRLDSQPPYEVVARGESGADGRYQLLAPSSGLWAVQISLPGFVPVQSEPFDLLDELEVPDAMLVQDEGLVVQVQSAAGKPIAGAFVRVEAAEQQRRFRVATFEPALRLSQTGADGTVRFPRGGGENYDVAAAATGFVPAGVADKRAGRLTLTLAPGIPTTVEVRGSDGKTAAQTIVAALEPPVPCGSTTANGRFDLMLPAESALVVRAVAPDGRAVEAPLRVQPTAPGTTAPALVLTLPPATVLSGRVIDAATRKPVNGAIVHSGRAALGSARSATDGNFKLSLIGTQRPDLRLLVAASGYVDETQEIVLGSNARPVTIALRPAATILGQVVDARGAPVTAARVALAVKPGADGMRSMRRTMRGLSRSAPEARTNARGAFRITRVDPAEIYELSARATGFARGSIDLLALKPGETRSGANLTLSSGMAIVGRVVDGQGRPLPSAMVTAKLAPADRQSRAMVFVTGVREGKVDDPPILTDSEGRFTVSDLAVGRYDLTVARPGFAKQTVPGITLSETVTQHDAGNVALEPGHSIQGRVLDKLGAPIDGVALRVQSTDPMQAMLSRFQPAEPDATTSSDGWFEIPDRREGESFDLSASRAGYVAIETNGVKVPLTEPLTITLQAASIVSGKVTDPEGRPIAGATLAMSRERSRSFGGRSMMMNFVIDDQTDATGQFRFEDVEPGKVSIEASAAGRQPKQMPAIDIPQGKDLTDLQFVLDQGAVLEGRVTTEDGTPVPGAQVGPLREGEPLAFRGFGPGRTETDGDGVYQLDGLTPGSVSIEATESAHPRAVKTIELKPGRNVLDLVMSGGQRVGGRVVDEAGIPIVGASLSLRTSEFGPIGNGPEAHSGNDGSFQFTGVNAGIYLLDASRDGYSTLAEPLRVTVEAAPVAGLVITLKRGGTIYGSLVGLDPTQFGDAEVRLLGGGFGFGNAVKPNFQGGYRIENVPPGNYSVEARLGTTGRRAKGTIELTEKQQEARLDLEFGRGITLTGTVRQGGTPIEDAYVTATLLDRDGRGWNRSDHAGKFRIEALEPGRYELEVNWNGASHEETLDLSADKEVSVDFPAASIRGKVLDAQTREPIAGASLTIEPQAAPTSGRPTRGFFMPGSTSDSAGSFSLDNLADGSYIVRAKKPGYAAGEQLASVLNGSGGSELKLLLDPTEGLAFDVRFATGAIPQSVAAAVLDPTGRQIVSGSYATAENGRIRLSTVPPGRWEVLLSASGSPTTSVSATAPGAPLAVQLAPACQLRLTIKDLQGDTARASAVLTDTNGRRVRLLGTFGQLQAEFGVRGGTSEIGPLPPGPYVVQVTASDGRNWQGNVVLRPGEPTKLEL